MLNAANAIAIENLLFQYEKGSKAFGFAISSLVIETGARVALVGSSGVGKSTLLGLIGGVLKPVHGQINILGNRLDQLSVGQRDRFRANNLGIIFQQFNLLPYLTMLDNVMIALEFSDSKKLSSLEKRQRCEQLLKRLRVDTAQFGHQKVSELSVGQQQRVAAARAFAGEPALIIADEPTSALDDARQTEFLDLLFFQQEQTGATLLTVTHDRRVAGRFDRIIDLKDICQEWTGEAPPI